VGLAIGVLASLAVTRAFASTLFGVSPSDPATLAAAAALMTATATLAAFIPARRAATVDPMLALRGD
jgi:ABC-type antimicrobial peptide transport system permease subunit